ncbi:hypothetical protein BD310DRAFT_497372 [Dichomitus squalens]|uniref:Uncharacterized protein n=1 Tax=Dichomitus squalens TaxID=114155 RepID=A0A4Q9PUE4_9APHY|nr:hypothetical protein BD310DRAFT_497372 [Dichomitus squalens]
MPACNKHACQDPGSCANKHELHTTPRRSRLRSTLVDLFSLHEFVWPGDCGPLSCVFRLDTSVPLCSRQKFAYRAYGRPCTQPHSTHCTVIRQPSVAAHVVDICNRWHRLRIPTHIGVLRVWAPMSAVGEDRIVLCGQPWRFFHHRLPAVRLELRVWVSISLQHRMSLLAIRSAVFESIAPSTSLLI